METPREWWKEFFTDLWVDVQLARKTAADTSAEVDFMETALQLEPSAAVLDVPCGVGRHAIELADRGYSVAAVDITRSFLREGRRRAKARSLKITWKHVDMRELPWESDFDAVVCFWGSFGYFDDAGNAEFLQAVARSLKPGGRFLVDTHVMETLLTRIVDKRRWSYVGDRLVLEESHYDHERSCTITDWIVIHHGKRFQKPSHIRLYSYKELCDLLEAVGLSDFKAFGTLGFAPFGLGSPRLYLIATKR
jgi:SAM-dependent methyltransferase